MKSAVTISLVREAAGGPFVFWHDLAHGCKQAAELGFDAVEIFAPGPDEFDAKLLRSLLEKNNLKVAAFGTGAGWVKHKLTLTSSDKSTRERAISFIASMIDRAAEFQAPAIIGSMQGRVENNRAETLSLLREAFDGLGEYALQKKQPVLLEPLNRYETNILNTVEQSLEFLSTLKTENVRLLLDLFHMNIEEQDMAAWIRLAGPAIGHIHLADSNRRAVGFGHTDFRPIIQALRAINYQGYLSAEILPVPNSEAAAAQTIATIKSMT
jgi:sugar phosphate isomerase/epimerase